MTDLFDAPTTSTPAGKDDKEFDQYGRYRIPHPVTGKTMSWTRATTFAKSIADTFALTQWQMRMTVKGLSMRPDLYALAASTAIDDKDALNRIAEDAKEAAAASAGANSGTALHAFSEQVDRGEKPFIPAPWDADIRAYQTTLAGHGIAVDPAYIECKVVVPDLAVAGTFDRLVHHRGALVVGDLKTGKNLDYGWLEIAIQLALYSRATHLWDKTTRTHRPMPALDRSRALVFHLPVGQATCTVYELDLEQGWAAAQLCGQVRDWRRRKGLATAVSHRKWPTSPAPDTTAALIEGARSVAELERVWSDQSAVGAWLAHHTEAAKARKHVLLSTQGSQ